MITTVLLLALCGAGPQEPGQHFPADETATLLAPTLVRASGDPIDVDVGHAAPLMRDWDGNGTVDLLVGQYGGGHLRIYSNGAKSGEPKLGEHVWGESQGSKLKIPSG